MKGLDIQSWQKYKRFIDRLLGCLIFVVFMKLILKCITRIFLKFDRLTEFSSINCVFSVKVLGHWGLCPIITSRASELVEVRTTWPGHLVIKKIIICV